MSAPFVPNTKIKSDPFKSNVEYIEKLKKRKMSNRDSLLSDYEDDHNADYNPNWADEF
jgi:hypothetical protein